MYLLNIIMYISIRYGLYIYDLFTIIHVRYLKKINIKTNIENILIK